MFKENAATWGGAIGSGSATELIIAESAFLNNVATSDGGGLSLTGASAVVTNCCFEGNVARNGAGGALRRAGGSGSLEIIDSTVEHNGALIGGGIALEQGTLVVTGSVIAGNGGNGVALLHQSWGMSFQSTLFCENTPDNIDGPWADLGGNEFLDECPSPIPGDLNGDGSVGVPDLLLLLGAWGECDDCTPGESMCFGDLDGDCTVGVADLLALLANWG